MDAIFVEEGFGRPKRAFYRGPVGDEACSEHMSVRREEITLATGRHVHRGWLEKAV